MNKDRIEGRWKLVVGNVRERWGRITHDDYLVITGRREQRLGKRQLRFGLASDVADREVARWQ